LLPVRSHDLLIIMKSPHLLIYIIFLTYFSAELEPHVISTIFCRCFLISHKFLRWTLFTIETLNYCLTYVVVWCTLCACTKLDHLWNLSSSSFLPCLVFVPEDFKKELFCHWFYIL
jgi:hypothetical protein